MSKKYVRCWYCSLNGYNILDASGSCKRCGTNLKKYPTRESHIYPDLNTERITREVLGTREKFSIPYDSDQGD